MQHFSTKITIYLFIIFLQFLRHLLPLWNSLFTLECLQILFSSKARCEGFPWLALFELLVHLIFILLVSLHSSTRSFIVKYIIRSNMTYSMKVWSSSSVRSRRPWIIKLQELAFICLASMFSSFFISPKLSFATIPFLVACA